jgi:molybdopterin converting factor small subunit
MIRVLIPSQLHAYSGGQSCVEAQGRTVEAVLDDLDRRFPGLKFRVVDEQARIRRHIRVYIGRDAARDVTTAVDDGAELMIFGALSGG